MKSYTNNRLKSLIREALEEVIDECGMDCSAIEEEEIATEGPIEEECEEGCACNETSLRNARSLMERMGCNLQESKKGHQSLLKEHYQHTHKG